MVTYSQYIKNHRRTKTFRSSTPHFEGCPFKYGTCVRVGKVKPKKPNSAQRSIAKVRLSNNRLLIAYVPGFGHQLVKNSEVMVRGGRVPDMPGCKYHILRGKKDLTTAETVERTQRRSKFAKKSPIVSTKLKRRSARKAKRRELLKTGFVVDDDTLKIRLQQLRLAFN
jgi:small subunit ribosomal protein S12